jgi:AcrR family transcriptional regulator
MTLEKRGKRTEIADAALRLIGTRGITELTMANLAAELGVTSGSFFRHFKSRDEILVEVARRVAELVEATFPDPDLPPLERLERLFRARTEVLGRQSGIARLIFSEQFTKALPPEAVAHIHGVVKRTRACLLEALREAAEAGQIRRDIPPEDLLLPVIGTLQHLGFLTALAPGGAYPRRPATSRVLATLLTLIGAAGPRDGLPVQARKEDRMRPTTVLMHEHEAVLAALEVLEGAGQALASGRQEAARDLGALLDFFRSFVDHCHHGKEERVLFP